MTLLEREAATLRDELASLERAGLDESPRAKGIRHRLQQLQLQAEAVLVASMPRGRA